MQSSSRRSALSASLAARNAGGCFWAIRRSIRTTVSAASVSGVVGSNAAHLQQREAEGADLGEQFVECCLVGERPGDGGGPSCRSLTPRLVSTAGGPGALAIRSARSVGRRPATWPSRPDAQWMPDLTLLR
jgi:hypothetical protein